MNQNLKPKMDSELTKLTMVCGEIYAEESECKWSYISKNALGK